MYKLIPFSSGVIYGEAWLRGTGSATGDPEDMGRLLFFNSITLEEYPGVYLNAPTGQITAHIGNNYQDLHLYTANTWYKITIKLDFENQKMDVWVNDDLKIQNMSGVIASGTYICFLLGEPNMAILPSILMI